MLLLALDTATPAVTVALHDGERVLAEVSEVDARRHAELLAPGIEAVLAQAGATHARPHRRSPWAPAPGRSRVCASGW